MGTFQGHALPGSFFMVFALWWICQLPRRIIFCKRKGVPYTNTLTFPLPFRRLEKLPAEGIIKVIACSIAAAAELFAATNYGKEKTFVFTGDLQHVTMYGFFLLSGITDIIVSRGSQMVPKGLDYITLSLAFAIEALLFKFHLHGRSELDVILHTLLLNAIAACAVVTLMEYHFNSCPTFLFCRAFFTFVHGVCFFQAAAILYPLGNQWGWDHEDPDQHMLAVMMFAWLCGGSFIFIGGVYLCSYCIHRKYAECLGLNAYQIVKDPGTALSDFHLELGYESLPQDPDDELT